MHELAINYMDDDTCQATCRCGWVSLDHEDEQAAQTAYDAHAMDGPCPCSGADYHVASCGGTCGW